MALTAPFSGAIMANAGDNLRWAYAQLARAGIATATEHSYDARSQSEVFGKLAQQADCAVRVRAYEIGTLSWPTTRTTCAASGPVPTCCSTRSG